MYSCFEKLATFSVGISFKILCFICSQKKLKRVRVMSDDEDSDKEGEPEDERDRVAQEIFDGDDVDDDRREKSPRPAAAEEEGGEFGNIDDSGEESGS